MIGGGVPNFIQDMLFVLELEKMLKCINML